MEYKLNNEEGNIAARIPDILKSQFVQRAEDLNAVKESFGDKAVEVIKANRSVKTRERWSTIAKRFGKNDIAALKKILWDNAGEFGFEFTCGETPDGMQFRVTKCPFADAARATNNVEWGLICQCNEDFDLVQGFNPDMGFKRTKTLMEGHDCCDHFYFMKNKNP